MPGEKEEKEEEIPTEEVQPEVKPAKEWVPKTSLGKEVAEGKIKSLDEIFESGRRILEPEIVDKLVPNLKSELILIGGRAGKGGGIERIPIRITATMHKSGRRFRASAFAVVGNEDGIVGIGKGSSVEPRDAVEKAIKKAKLNIIKIKRGCGSWECGCKEEHSIPYKVEGKCGSVRVILLPAPNGVGLVASDEAKKILRLAGIKDVWMKTFGNTKMRINLITAIFNALKKLYIYER
jgi:small subunit ribosomal protein S5